MLVTVIFSCACHQRQPAKGFRLDIAASPKWCGDGREIVLSAVGGGKVRVNAGLDAAMAEVMKRIHEANRYRAVKLVFIKAEPDVSWGEFMELAD